MVLMQSLSGNRLLHMSVLNVGMALVAILCYIKKDGHKSHPYIDCAKCLSFRLLPGKLFPHVDKTTTGSVFIDHA